jgi:SAM-dependent methyltransferase
VTAQAPFDALAELYDRQRPSYPDGLFQALCKLVPVRQSGIAVDAGAGTGIALGQLVQHLGSGWRYLAVDISEGMVTVGRRRWPMVEWRLGRIEEILSEIEPFDLMLVAQALQWFDRPRFYQGCRARLVLGGVLAILQNNRDWKASEFLDEYEALLEETSPGYTRHYRSFDVEAELAGLPWGAGEPIIERVRWTRQMSVGDFIEMSSSSTRVQAALKADAQGFTQKVLALCARYAVAGQLDIPYTSELFAQIKDRD